MLLTAVFLLSLSSIAFEVLLARVFSICQWNHLSFMVISIALFGLAASGTFLSLLDTRSKKGWEQRFASKGPATIFISLYTLTTISSFTILNNMPLDYFRLPLEPVQALYLLIAYLLLALPFFFTGLVIALAYILRPAKTGFIYFATMAGSACGALFPIPLLPYLGEGSLIILASLIPLAAVPCGGWKPIESHLLKKSHFRFRLIMSLAFFSAIAFITVFLLSAKGGSLIEVKPSPYKALSQLLQFPDTRITTTVPSIRGRIDITQSPYIRFAPGLSLKFTERLPEQWAVFRDGDNPFVFYNLLSKKDALFSRFTLPYLGYFISANPEHVLLIQQAGGSGIPCAIASGAREITVVEQNPQIAQMVADHYHFPVINQNPKAFLASSDKRFNIIQVENWGTSIPGTAALNQEFFFTKETFTQYLKHLTDPGILIIARKLLLPPADSIRLWAAAFESLRSLDCKNPERHLAILRNYDTFTLVVSTMPLDTARIKNFARDRNFDLVYLHGTNRKMVNRFNVFDFPYHFLEIKHLAEAYQSGTEKAYFRSYLLDVEPQKDRRAFPFSFLKWHRLKEIYKTTGSRLYSLIMSGEIIVSVVFLEALGVSVLLLVFPLFAIPKHRQKPSIARILFFLSVGTGFMFVELYYIKAYMLLFENPVISFTVVLSGILIFSAAGGLWSQGKGPHTLRHSIIVLIAVLVIVFFSLETILHQILGFSRSLRYILAFLLLMPTGFMLGLPFPLGMRYLLKTPVEQAYAWAANGCASVLTAILSAQIAISLGISILIICSLGAYLIALICAGKR